MSVEDRRRLENLPWNVPMEEWLNQGVELLNVRRGESRHPVVFVEREGIRYAIKETTPHMAEREIHNFREIELRGIPSLSPIGTVIVPTPPIPLDVPKLGGITQYISGDRGYTVTRLAPRVVPHVLLYRLPFAKKTKQRLLSAVAVLMVELHEHGVYWGDPSLANVLLRIDGRSILAIMADAETSELFPGPISEGLREQDLALFGESLSWQAEDLRTARGLPEDEQILDESDYHYFEQRYHWLRREHSLVSPTTHFTTLYQIQQMLHSMSRFGYSLRGMTGHTWQHLTTILPGWHQRRIQELLHISVPRIYAHRFYDMILGHQALLSEQRHHPVNLKEAARDWYTRYHLPTILLLRQYLTKDQDPMQAYFAVMRHKWNLSRKAGYEIPIEEALLDWFMQQAETGHLGSIDPAAIASWWRDRQPVSVALEQPTIASEELEPLLSTGEKPLVRLQPPELEQRLPEILEKQHDEPVITEEG
ncbi:MAG TPA: hypothetical protein DHW02_01815 [Ktedonobacter sp.]|nr:hypothetical protein [Ktedonobacter sp.]